MASSQHDLEEWHEAILGALSTAILSSSDVCCAAVFETRPHADVVEIIDVVLQVIAKRVRECGARPEIAPDHVLEPEPEPDDALSSQVGAPRDAVSAATEINVESKLDPAPTSMAGFEKFMRMSDSREHDCRIISASFGAWITRKDITEFAAASNGSSVVFDATYDGINAAIAHESANNCIFIVDSINLIWFVQAVACSADHVNEKIDADDVVCHKKRKRNNTIKSVPNLWVLCANPPSKCSPTDLAPKVSWIMYNVSEDGRVWQGTSQGRVSFEHDHLNPRSHVGRLVAKMMG
jgi:hypothetical protein